MLLSQPDKRGSISLAIELGECFASATRAIGAYGPDLAGSWHARYRVQPVVRRAGIGAAHDAPFRAVPALDECLRDVAAVRGRPDSPDIAGGENGHAIQDGPIQASTWIIEGAPTRAVPVFDQRVVVASFPYCPHITCGDGRYSVEE